jgi:hypothetical protein
MGLDTVDQGCAGKVTGDVVVEPCSVELLVAYLHDGEAWQPAAQ